MASVFHRWFQRRFRNPASPFATHGLLWVSFPAFSRYYGDAKTASVLLLRLCPWLGDSSVLFLFSFLVDRKFVAEPGSWSTGLILSGLLFRGDRRLSQLPRRPQCCFALLFDPGRTSTPDRCGASVLPPLRKPRRLPRSIFFRGSITPLCSSLPTLEGIISDCQPRLACGGWSDLSARALSRRVLVEAFFCSWFHPLLLSVLCLLL